MMVATEPRDSAPALVNPRRIGLALGASIALLTAPSSAQVSDPPASPPPPRDTTP